MSELEKQPEPGRRSLVGRTVATAAGVVGLAAAGIAAGLELERRLVSKARRRVHEADDEPYFSLRSGGPRVVTEDGVELHVEVDEFAEDPDGITVVMVHGYALSLDCWHHQRAYFRDRARVVLYDQRSHGRSGRSDPEHCRIPQLARDLAQVLDEVVGDGPVLLLGHSMGGMTIMHLAQDRPELFGDRIIGVGLCATSAGDLAEHSLVPVIPGRTFARITPPLLTTLIKLPQIVEQGRRAGSDIGWVVTKRMAFGRNDVPTSMVEFVSEMLAEIPLQVVADFYPAFAEVDEVDAFDTLAHVECCVIGGVKDTITPFTHTERILELLPSAESVVIEDAGHMVMIEHHDQVNAAFSALLERSRRAVPSR
ncbi:MAG TPA: alpha/beta hydrolase [Candidatus Avipropionibacterium avicola]|uniref:Alpha/beta hydrolase n=1 Tax=Candidatus Avipropionibacterium avicola TaxID=2840701 RepID=A0A9D1GZF9_9ACTN|nr:alpha/beta hydrolase [Candidatus Avipropionibacterium avicola]